MLQNYFKIAFRNLFREKVYSFINIFGLAVGIACCLLIGLYVHNEWSFDTFHSNADRIYRAWIQETADDGRVILNTATPVPLVQAIRENIPEAEAVTYVYQFGSLVKTSAAEEGVNESILSVNGDFFSIFDFQFVSGNRAEVFQGPGSVVLSESTAQQFFGTHNPLNETLSIRFGDAFRDFTVTGILRDAPANSSLDYSILISDQNLTDLVGERGTQSWFQIYGSTYMLLQQGVNPDDLDSKLDDMMRGALGEEYVEESEYQVGLQPLTDIYLNTDFPQNLASVSDPVYSYILAAIAAFILMIACVNFMTLSISRSASRAREVGIRKTIGANRYHLMYQFWGEALLMTFIALALGVTFTEILLPFFNDLSETTLSLTYNAELIFTLAGIAVFISLVAGIYPALILSGFKPVEVLKGRLRLSADKSFFRQSMVVTQFALSIALIIGTLIVKEQLSFVQNKNLGYQSEQLLVIESGVASGPGVTREELYGNISRRKEILKSELEQVPEITALTASSYTPVHTGGWFRLGFRDNQDQQHSFHGNIIDEEFIPALGIQIVEGRNFSVENSSDFRRGIIINRAMADYFGWDEPLGERIPGPEFEDHEVIGVVENFHFESLHTPIDPLAMAMSAELLFSGINGMNISASSTPRYTLKLTTDNLGQTMASLQNIWQGIAPGVPFSYTFVDEALDSQYRDEQRLSRIVTTGAFFAVLIACLGLFGLASLMVVRRTKEIGVRKVLGASSRSIVILINKEFTRLILIAFIIAAPVAWYAMSNWLQDFAYRIEPGAGIFILAEVSALIIAWLTVSYQSIRATLINPTESLRSE